MKLMSEEKLIVDRIEGEYAVCELSDRTTKDVLLSSLPKDVKEGSVLILQKDETYVQSSALEQERRKKLFEMQNKLFSKK